MNRVQFDGGLYCFALPDGGYGVLFPSSHIQTSEGRVELPGEDVLALVGTRWQGRLCMAGQGQQSGKAWLWTGRWTDVASTFGVSPCAFGAGALYVVVGGSRYLRVQLDGSALSVFVDVQIGTQGIRYVDGMTPVSGDSTYRAGELFEWTEREDIRIGQGHEGGALMQTAHTEQGRKVWSDTGAIELGDCRFIRFDRAQEKLGIGIVKLVERCAVLHFLSVAELQAPPKPEPVVSFPEPWKVSIATWPQSLERGVRAVTRFSLGNGIDVEAVKDERDELHISVFKDGVLQDRSAAPRHINLKG